MVNYDNQPSVFEAVGNGSYRYRYDIQEVVPEVVEGNDNEAHGASGGWKCKEVIVWSPVSANKITQAVIEGEYPASYEQKLVNEYNAAQLGLYGAKTSDQAKTKINAYKDFLETRAALKAQVDADCARLGIE